MMRKVRVKSCAAGVCSVSKNGAAITWPSATPGGIRATSISLVDWLAAHPQDGGGTRTPEGTISHGFWVQLRETFPDAEIVDATPILIPDLQALAAVDLIGGLIRARQGLSLRGLVPPGVAAHIEAKGLYR